MAVDRVEFVDVESSGDDGPDGDLVETGDPGGPRRGPGRFGLGVVGLVVVALLAVLLVGRVAAGDERPSPRTTATPGPVGRTSATVTQPVFGLVGLPRAIGTPRQLVASQSGDVVWMLDSGAGVVRIEGGTVTAVQLLESQATAIAVDPSGTHLYVAVAAGRPELVELDATTLSLGPSRPLARSISALAVSTDAVWAASGSTMLRLDLDSLSTLAEVALPGVVITDHLRIQTEPSGNQQYVVGLATGGNDDGTVTSRFLRIDPLANQAAFGSPVARVAGVATSNYLTWVGSSAATADGAETTRGFASVLDPTPLAQVTPPLAARTRIYDGGGGFAAFVSVAPDRSVFTCHDDGGFATSEVDVAPAVPDAVITGQVLRSDTAFYVVTDRGLVRAGVGACR